MKTSALKTRLLAPALLALAVVSALNLPATLVYETGGEFFTSADFNGDGIPDTLVLDKSTGNARVGYGDGNGHLTWSAPLITGVNNVSGCAVGHFKETTRDVLVVTAAALNRVQLYDLSGTNTVVSLGASTQSGIGPHALAALASPFGAPPPPFSTLLIASSLNDPPAERLDLVTNFPIGFASSAGQYSESGPFDSPNALPIFTNGPTFAAGIVRGATSDTLDLWQFTNSPGVFLSLSNLPPGCDYVFGTFAGQPLPDFLFFQTGNSNLTVCALLQTNTGWEFGVPQALTAAEPVQQIFYLPAGAGGSAVLVLTDGLQTVSFSGGVPTITPKDTLTVGAAGNVFTGAATLANGQFALFDAPAGSLTSANGQVIHFDGTNFMQLSATNLPGLTTRSTRGNVWLFQLEPFVHRDAGFSASVSAPDWSDSVSGLPAALNVVTESDGGTNTGLGSAATSNLGTPPFGATNALANQYNSAISVFSYAAPQAAEPVSIVISPPPGPYGGPLTISLSWPGTGREAFYRVVPGGTWQSYNAPFQITNDATIQYYGQPLLSSARSQIQFAAYTLGIPPTGGTNNPIVTTPGNTNIVAILSTNQLTISPDGTVFYGRVSASGNYTIWAINLDGSSDTYITTGARPRVSRDGKYLAFLRGGTPLVTEGNAYVRNLQTGQETLLYTNTSYTIGYDWDLSETNLIFDWSCWLWNLALGSTTATELPLPSPDCYDDAPVVNPVDGRLAFQDLDTSGGVAGLYITSTNRTAKQQLYLGATGASWPAWSPDGQWLSFVDGNSQSSAFTADDGTNLWVVRPDGTDLSQISGFQDGTNRFPHGAIWGPDGFSLVAAGTIFGINGLWLIPLTPDLKDCDGPPILLPTSAGDAIDFAGSVVVAASATNVGPAPPLGLFIRQTPSTVVVYWSTNFAGYTLESTPNLPATGWSAIAGPYFEAGSYFEYWESRADLANSKFFRLHYTGAMVLSQPPPLQIQAGASSVLLSWPNIMAGFDLETTTNLAPPIRWSPAAVGTATNIEGQIQVKEGFNRQTPEQFFRLRSP